MHSSIRPATGLFLAAIALMGCAGNSGDVTRADLGEEVVITDFTLGPPGARPGACYGKDVTPAVIEQVTERVLVAEAEIGPEGNIITPAEFEERSSHQVVQGREEIYFETPCPPRWTPDFIASVQRALITRGIYKGEASGTLDHATRQAIRAFQVKNGLNSGILSTENARALGLVELDLDG
ncbi:Putative peptidoglycan-binding domain-containing protein [Maritimibacter sp. HL-12]|nr:Putative peptidoglycan-binding domain-containing protein [Maritimibacter sp. HL-12]